MQLSYSTIKKSESSLQSPQEEQDDI